MIVVWFKCDLSVEAFRAESVVIRVCHGSRRSGMQGSGGGGKQRAPKPSPQRDFREEGGES